MRFPLYVKTFELLSRMETLRKNAAHAVGDADFEAQTNDIAKDILGRSNMYTEFVHP
jgi:hypothetical protein